MSKRFYVFDLEDYTDERGQLITLERSKNIPFEIKRVYYILNVNQGEKRACHAHKESQRILICLNGHCLLKIFDGLESLEVNLNNPQKAIFFDSKVWCELSDFSDNAIVLALSSHNYDENEYIRNYDVFLKFIEEDNN